MCWNETGHNVRVIISAFDHCCYGKCAIANVTFLVRERGGGGGIEMLLVNFLLRKLHALGIIIVFSVCCFRGYSMCHMTQQMKNDFLWIWRQT